MIPISSFSCLLHSLPLKSAVALLSSRYQQQSFASNFHLSHVNSEFLFLSLYYQILEAVVHSHLYWTLLIYVSAHSTPGVVFQLNENSSYKSYQSLLSNSHIAFFHPPTLFLCGLWYSWPLHTMEKFPLGPRYHCLLALLSVFSLLLLNLQTSK